MFSMLTDLAEVVSVTPAQPMPGPPKKTDDKSFFDVNTKSFYIFLSIEKVFHIILMIIFTASYKQTNI